MDDERKENSDEEKCQMLPHSEVFEESTTSGTSFESSFHPKPKQRVTLTSELEEFMQEMVRFSSANLFLPIFLICLKVNYLLRYSCPLLYQCN